MPAVDPVASDPDLPRRTGVVVVGGGIIGASTTLFLARKGIPTVLCEKGAIAGEQSGRNWGWCRLMGRDPREIPLITESLRLWRNLNELVGAETGFRTTGIAYLCDTQQDVERHEAWLASVHGHQIDSRIVTGAALDAVLPGSARPWAGALYTPSDGGAEPEKATPAIAEAARRAGAVILTGCAVRGLDIQAGRVAGVVTERGRIACDSVVLAGGAWSRLFCGNHGVDLPQLKVLGSVSRTARLAGAPDCSAKGPGFGFRKRLDGGYVVAQAGATISDIVPDSFHLLREFGPLIRVSWRDLRLRIGRRFVEEWRTPRRWALDGPSPFERVRVLDPAPSRRLLDQAVSNIGAAFPAFAPAVTAERWGGMIDVLPDEVPVISPVEALPGFHLATGFSGHGFGIGPGAGRLMADIVAGDPPVVDPTPFRFERFQRSIRGFSPDSSGCQGRAPP